MLEEMFHDGDFDKAKNFMSTIDFSKPNIIASSIQKMNAVVKEIGDWKDQLKKFKCGSKLSSTDTKHTFGVPSEYIFRE